MELETTLSSSLSSRAQSLQICGHHAHPVHVFTVCSDRQRNVKNTRPPAHTSKQTLGCRKVRSWRRLTTSQGPRILRQGAPNQAESGFLVNPVLVFLRFTCTPDGREGKFAGSVLTSNTHSSCGPPHIRWCGWRIQSEAGA